MDNLRSLQLHSFQDLNQEDLTSNETTTAFKIRKVPQLIRSENELRMSDTN